MASIISCSRSVTSQRISLILGATDEWGQEKYLYPVETTQTKRRTKQSIKMCECRSTLILYHIPIRIEPLSTSFQGLSVLKKNGEPRRAARERRSEEKIRDWYGAAEVSIEILNFSSSLLFLRGSPVLRELNGPAKQHPLVPSASFAHVMFFAMNELSRTENP